MSPIRLTSAAAALCGAAALLAAPASADFVLRAPMKLSAATAPAAILTLSRANIDFGSVAITDRATGTVTLMNSGSIEGSVTLRPPVDPFGLEHDCPTSLAPAASCTLTFTFSPTTGGNATGNATVAGQEVVLGGYGDMITVASAAGAAYHTLVVRTDGTLWATGHNGYGQLGLGDTANRSSFTQVASMGTSAAKVVAGGYHTLVVKKDGTLWGTGYNSSGQLGLGDTTNRSSFTQITSMGTSTAKLAAGTSHTVVVTTDGGVWAAGYNGYGALGLGDVAARTSFTHVTSLGTSAAKVVAGTYHTMVVTNDGSLWGAGHNLYGQLGLGDTANRTSFVQVPSMAASVASVVSGASHVLVVKTDGTLWGAGRNSNAQLGLEGTSNRTSFVQIASMGTSAANIVTGDNHTLVVKKDGTFWATGLNNVGQLGLGDTAARASFTQVAALGTSASRIVAGGGHTLVVKSDGTLWGTGHNGYGQLGLGGNTNVSKFSQVP